MGNLAYSNDERREELLNGVICMSPRPLINLSIVSGNIFYSFKNYLKGKKCIPFNDGVDVNLTNKDRVIPDTMIVCNPEIIKTDGIYGTPDLIVEVLSRSTAKNDRGYKKDLYECCGVKEYWIVDTDSKSVEVYLLKKSKLVLDDVYTIMPDYELQRLSEDESVAVKRDIKVSLYDDFSIPLTDIFYGLQNCDNNQA